MADDGRLVVVSNRVPSASPPSGEEAQRDMPVGGLVSALQPALERRRSLWMGWSGKAQSDGPDTQVTISKVGGVQLASMDLARHEVDLFYNVFSNRTLWPLLHSFPDKATIRHDSYRTYRNVNRKFANALISILRSGDMVWIQDYHLFPLGHELRRLGWADKIGFFLHIPFPPADVFAILPWAEELLGMLFSYDLVGMQTHKYIHNLHETLTQELGAIVEGETVHYQDRSLVARPYPVGTDPEAFRTMAAENRPTRVSRFLSQTSQDRKILLGVDRLDYTKGIPQRMLAFERLLDHYPSLRGNATLIQISAPSRSRVPEYIRVRDEVDSLVGRINGRFGEAGWMPIHPLHRSYSQVELAAFYRSAKVCMVTPLRDGMNLVAKEFVASQAKDPGVLVLSKFCGAAESMDRALVVNPYDIQNSK